MEEHIISSESELEDTQDYGGILLTREMTQDIEEVSDSECESSDPHSKLLQSMVNKAVSQWCDENADYLAGLLEERRKKPHQKSATKKKGSAKTSCYNNRPFKKVKL